MQDHLYSPDKRQYWFGCYCNIHVCLTIKGNFNYTHQHFYDQVYHTYQTEKSEFVNKEDD